MTRSGQLPARGRAVLKRDRARPPEVKVLTSTKGTNYPPGRMLISSPLELREHIRRIPIGRVMTLPALRTRLAKQHDADYTCPLTTSIFLRILAEAALEESDATVPYWRIVRDDGSLLDKLPGGVEAQAQHLESEGVRLVRRANRILVSELPGIAWPRPR